MRNFRNSASTLAETAVRRALGLRGWALTREWELEGLRRSQERSHLLRRTLEDKIPLLVERFSTDCLLDVGANSGQFGRFARHEAGYDRFMVSYEPIAELAQRLRNDVAEDSSWEVVQAAISSESGIRDFHEMESSTFSSLQSPLASMPEQFKERNSVVRSYQVTTTTLEHEIARLQDAYGFDHFFLKTDTQGHDNEVLAGLGSSAEYVDAILCELSFVPLYKEAPTWNDMIGQIGDLGFVPMSIDPITWDHDSLRLVEADVLFVRSTA